MKTESIKTNSKTKTITGAEAVIRSLIDEGVTTLFGYPGGAIMPVYDALYDYQNQIKHILVRHEQGAIHAAEGYARVSNQVGVCMATSGPGATNLITGLADAIADSTPLVCITGQVASHLLGTDAFQETDVMGISTPVTKWNCIVTKAEDIPVVLAKAFYIAQSGRPGPVLVDITKDAQFGKLEYEYKKCSALKHYNPKPTLSSEKLKEAAELINDAKAPYLLVGQGILLSGAQQELIAFVEKTGIPVASTLLGLSAFPCSHPLYAGMLGMHGNYAPNMLTNQCDVLIAVGMRFDDRVTGRVEKYAKQATIIHIDIDASELNKIVNTKVQIHADAKEALSALTRMVSKQDHSAWLNRFKEYDHQEKIKVLDKSIFSENGKLIMGEVVNKLSELTNGEAIIVTDVGQHQMVAGRYYKFTKTKSNVTSGGLGTMGFALPSAIGAKLAQPKREVIAIIGDGGFQMTLQELGTIFQYNISVKILILNNNFLGMVRQWQQLFFDKRYSFTEMTNPDFVTIAHGYKLKAERLEDRQDLGNALKRMLQSNEAFLLEAIVEAEENVFPMIPTGASVDEVLLEPSTK
ncbi:MAG TPA: biosynthetic-type acetolactate synthase large subunit [Bacteroidia bacterium]|nr:biosynthetic-type acetolactate synthase large subunit [Bacteroidia bacterium]